MYNKILTTILFLCISTNSYALSDIHNSHSLEEPKDHKLACWPFEGIFGTFDRQAAQRGAQVYLEVCSACHGLKHLYYRNLQDIGFSAEEIKAIASEKTVIDGPNSDGDMFDRPAELADNFVSPFPNEAAARASNNGAFPVDLSLIVKAREDGPTHLYSILTGYLEAPDDFIVPDGLYYNQHFEGGKISMPPPLVSGQVDFIDRTPATIEQMAHDVTIFLQWAAEPEMEHRKSMGLKVMLFLSIFTILFFISKKRTWKNIKTKIH